MDSIKEAIVTRLADLILITVAVVLVGVLGGTGAISQGATENMVSLILGGILGYVRGETRKEG